MLTVKSEHYWAQFLAQVKASPAPLNLQWERKTLACGRWSGSNRPTGIAWFQAWSLVFVVTAVLFWAQYMIRVTLSSKQKYRFLELFRVIFCLARDHFSLWILGSELFVEMEGFVFVFLCLSLLINTRGA